MARAASKMEGPKQPQPPTGGAPPIPRSPRGVKAFFVDVVREMKKVTWPTRSETNRMTGIVLAVCALVVGILTAMTKVAETLFDIVTGTGG